MLRWNTQLKLLMYGLVVYTVQTTNLFMYAAKIGLLLFWFWSKKGKDFVIHQKIEWIGKPQKSLGYFNLFQFTLLAAVATKASIQFIDIMDIHLIRLVIKYK